MVSIFFFSFSLSSFALLFFGSFGQPAALAVDREFEYIVGRFRPLRGCAQRSDAARGNRSEPLGIHFPLPGGSRSAASTTYAVPYMTIFS